MSKNRIPSTDSNKRVRSARASVVPPRRTARSTSSRCSNRSADHSQRKKRIVHNHREKYPLPPLPGPPVSVRLLLFLICFIFLPTIMSSCPVDRNGAQWCHRFANIPPHDIVVGNIVMPSYPHICSCVPNPYCREIERLIRQHLVPVLLNLLPSLLMLTQELCP
jgi:hypothetical protein